LKAGCTHSKKFQHLPEFIAVTLNAMHEMSDTLGL